MATYVVVGLLTRMHSWSKSPFYTSKDAGSKETCTKDILFSALSSPKAKGETAPLSFGSSFGFPRIKGNAHEALVEREGLPSCMPMGAGFFEKARADSETSDLGLVMNKGIVVGLIKLAKPRFPLSFTYVVENSRRYSISDLTESMKLCFSCSRPVMAPFIWLPPFSSECLIPII
ncbi:hypothetical protein FXO38_17900 [Capsicum annuum]|nr:hypothetical protein FXO38_17900 [Capsicum annuum]KAF3651601.1 hypothetical protein FXO37_17924 [Capsicum annuum]